MSSRAPHGADQEDEPRVRDTLAEPARRSEITDGASTQRPIVVRVLGVPAVAQDGVPTSLPRKAMALLAMLAVEPGPLPKDNVADRLWPDSAQARTNLRKAIMVVRDNLGADAIEAHSLTIGRGPAFGADVIDFEHGISRFEAHHPDGDVACDDCLTELSNAAALWRGDFLDGRPLEDSPVFDEWRLPHEARLRDRRSRLLSALVRAHVARNAWAVADRAAAEAIAHAPLDEEAQRARIRVLAWSGRRAEALLLYEHVCELLESELGVQPSERSVALSDAIRNDTLPPPPTMTIEARRAVPAGEDRSESVAEPGTSRSAAQKHEPPKGLANMLAAIRAGSDPGDLPEDQLRDIARHEPATLPAYLLARAARWLAPPEQLGRQFVPVDIALAPLSRPGADEEPRRWADLSAAIEELEARIVVLLGRPGAGKTTLLRRLELDLAMRGAAGEAVPVPLLVPLAGFPPDGGGDRAPSPRAWLEGVWRRESGRLPPLEAVAAEHGVLLLLDGLDEMPDRRGPDRRALAEAWRDFVRTDMREMPGVRAIFSCRELDYDVPLSGPDAPAPRLRAQPLSKRAMRAFVDSHVPESGRERFWERLSASGSEPLYRTPYLLQLLTEQAIDGDPPSDVAALLTSFIRSALIREVERDHPALAPGGALHERDVRQLLHDAWTDPYDLPCRGRLVPGLETLAAALLRDWAPGASAGPVGKATRASAELAENAMRVSMDSAEMEPDGSVESRFDRAAARALLGEETAAAVVSAGLGLGLLTEDIATDRLLFDHRLFLDYFVGRHLRSQQTSMSPLPPWLPLPTWRADEVVEPIETVIARLEAHQPMPSLPRTGWEEALAMAAVMSVDSDRAVLELAALDLPLAGRTVAGVPGRFSQATKQALRELLVERIGTPEADIRARIAAGEALGDLGDPRLTRVDDDRGGYLLPPMCSIEGGVFRIGSDDGHPDEAPAHDVELPAFQIARFEVTNAEWALFMADGGYDEARYWSTNDAAAWREGRGTKEGPSASAREWTERFRADPERLEQLFADGHMSADWHAIFSRRVEMSFEALEAHLAEMYPGGRLTEPHYWNDPRFSSPSQPVVGISWFEARAYASWLAERSGRRFRLPTEVEWEAACRLIPGQIESPAAGRAIALNTSESHIWRPTPIGIIAEGYRDASGAAVSIADMLGNIWEWTSSLYGREPGAPDFAYPYLADDGREDPGAPADVRRVTRGGAWDSPRSIATPTVRDAVRPGGRDQAYGMRLACGLG